MGLHSNEVFFRDTAHGFLAWAFATLMSATALVSSTTYLANGVIAGVNGGTAQMAAADPAQLYIDKLFRTTAPGATGAAAAMICRSRPRCCAYGSRISAVARACLRVIKPMLCNWSRPRPV